jgi:ribosomal protein S11
MIVYITETENNIFVTIVRRGKVLKVYSGGLVGMKGPKRKTPLSGELIGKEVRKFLYRLRVKQVWLRVRGQFSPVIRSFLRGVRNYRMKFLFLEEIKTMPHNGVRLKKARRL